METNIKSGSCMFLQFQHPQDIAVPVINTSDPPQRKIKLLAHVFLSQHSPGYIKCQFRPLSPLRTDCEASQEIERSALDIVFSGVNLNCRYGVNPPAPIICPAYHWKPFKIPHIPNPVHSRRFYMPSPTLAQSLCLHAA